MLDARFVAAALVSGVLSSAAVASEPASHDVALPTRPGQTVVVEWTGTALPGATGQGTTGNIVDPLLWVPCPSPGPDDAHTINLTVPEGAYGGVTVKADFHVEWAGSEPLPGDIVKDPDLVLSVYHDLLPVSSSDGGSPEENVGITDPAAGTYTAVVCPFLASQPTPYRGRLTLTAVEVGACTVAPTGYIPNAPATPTGLLGNPEQSGLPNYDLFGAETADVARQFPDQLNGRWQSAVYDRTLGVPTFLWARKDAAPAAVGALQPRDLLVEHARAHLRNEAKLLRLNARMIDEAVVSDAQFNGNGPAVVRFRQAVDGVEVFQRSLNVLLSRDYRPIAVSGYFATDTRPLAGGFATGAAQAVAAAWTSLGGALDASALSLTATRDGWQVFDKPELSGTHVFERAPRARAVYYPRANGLEPAYRVELLANARANGQLIAYAFVVSARDNAILHRQNLKADAAFGYRVFADTRGPLYQPYDSPLGNGYTPFPAADSAARLPRDTGSSTSLITLSHAGIVTGDPWLADDATTTVGNNVDACLDAFDLPSVGLSIRPTNTCDPELGDLHPPMTGTNTFDYALAPDENPAHENAKSAAIVNLFYMNNWLHDWWYNHGFDEAAGNAQADNYGRGGAENDPILAQGQDASGRNNANMSTPSDGSSPIMQQYLFDGPPVGEVRVTAPADSGALRWLPAAFGATEYAIEPTAVALADDGFGTSPTDGCGEAIPNPAGAPIPGATAAPPQASLAGKIALVDRGSCNFTAKVQFATASGAVALVVVNNADGDPITMGNADIPVAAAPVQPTDSLYQIPSLMIRKDDGERIKAQLGAGEVLMTLTRSASIDVDGTLDNQIIAHEFFHYVHHRLTDSSSQQTGAMSEGWGDISGFMLSVRPEDVRVPGNDAFQGAYGLAGYVANNFWQGIRRAPYTTDFAKNAFTFKHIAEGEPTPTGAPGTGNSEVHAAGEIWANMVYECYAGILNRRGRFGDAQSAMKDYIIAGFKMTPANATYTEGRDAILAAAMAADFGDYEACSRGFARRGAGLRAQAPARNSTDLTGVVEDYSTFVCAAGARSGDSIPSGEGAVLGAFNPAMLLSLLGLALLRRRRAAH